MTVASVPAARAAGRRPAAGRAGARPRLKSDEAFARLKGLLLDGALRAGAFVTQQALVERMRMPMAPVREAVKRAAAEGLVDVLPQRGVRVMEATTQSILDGFGLRLLVDREGARKHARRGPGPELARLKRLHETILAECRRGITDEAIRRGYEADWALHDALASAVDNALVAGIYARNRERLTILQRTRPMLPDRVVPSLVEHLAILAAIESRDPERADAAVAAHARQTLRWWGFLNPDFA
ncbi:HTH-type transcriptional repressor RspR [Burkholderiales bacterium]|nr:HTH-type transcriptional repressor RspR [Burkholderiales bacterium]